MKKILCIFILVVLFISSINAVALYQSEKKERLRINDEIQDSWKFTVFSSNPKIIEYGQYVKVNIKETNEFITNPGNPMLPFYSIVTTFPLGTKIIDVKCIHSQPEKIYLTKDIFPAPQPQWVSNNILPEINDPDHINFHIDELPLNDYYSYKTGGGIKDGKHVTFFSLHFYPLHFLPDERALQFISYAEIEVIYKKPIKPMLYDEDYSLVVISPASFSTHLQPLIPHKNKFGISGKIVILDEIFSGKYFNVEGRDNAEKIKYFIKNAVEHWKTSYVLLVGDIYKLPIRKTWIGELRVPTDLYYADIFFSDGSFSSWDTNDNGRYGEYWQQSDDIVDLYADVYIGRLACRNVIEVRNSVNKIINYEKSVYGKSWFKKIILCGGDTHPFGNVYEGEVTLDKIEQSMPLFTAIKLYASKGEFTPTLLNREINKGAGFMAYSGHGFEVSIGTHPPNSEEWISYNNLHLLGLFNINKLPIIFFDACLTAGLDYTLGDYLKISFIKFPLSCFAWSFVKKLFGGAIASIGATRVAFSMVDEGGPHAGSGYLALHFFKNYERGTTVAEMLVSSQNHYLNNVWDDPMTIEEFLLFGDPSLMVGGYND